MKPKDNKTKNTHVRFQYLWPCSHLY